LSSEHGLLDRLAFSPFVFGESVEDGAVGSALVTFLDAAASSSDFWL
jgi:hypothetical protein